MISLSCMGTSWRRPAKCSEQWLHSGRLCISAPRSPPPPPLQGRSCSPGARGRDQSTAHNPRNEIEDSCTRIGRQVVAEVARVAKVVKMAKVVKLLKVE